MLLVVQREQGTFSICCAPLWPHQCPSGVHEKDGGGRSTSCRVADTVFPLPQRLAVEGGLATGSRGPPSDNGKPPDIVGVHDQHAKVITDSFSAPPHHWSHPGHGAVSSLPSTSMSAVYLGYDPDVSTFVWVRCSWHPASRLCLVAYAGFVAEPEV